VNTPKILDTVVACAIFCWMACGVVWIALRRSKERRAEAEEQARERSAAERAIARVAAGMPANHPETPGAPGEYEATWLGAHYAWFADQLADIDASIPEAGAP
jgi:hypothetical protein